MKNKRLFYIVLSVAILLLVPFIAMLFNNEMNWSLNDFIIAGVLLLGTGLLFELVMRKVTQPRHRIILFAVILVGLLIIWIDLAVGIFGTPFSGS
jgi:hypothetical protein